MVHVVPDDGQWYPKGMMVRAVRSSGQTEIIPDPNGDEEVHSCTRDPSVTPGRWLVVETYPRPGYRP